MKTSKFVFKLESLFDLMLLKCFAMKIKVRKVKALKKLFLESFFIKLF